MGGVLRVGGEPLGVFWGCVGESLVRLEGLGVCFRGVFCVKRGGLGVKGGVCACFGAASGFLV